MAARRSQARAVIRDVKCGHRMDRMPKIWMCLSACGVVGGSYFLVVSAYYVSLYYLEPSNPIRHEYLEGTALALLLALPFWLTASAAISPVRSAVPGWIPAAIYMATIGLVLLFVLDNVVPVFFTVASQST